MRRGKAKKAKNKAQKRELRNEAMEKKNDESDRITVTTTTIPWENINQVKFFTIGTLVYSGLTSFLHPLTVLKVRNQVLSSKSKITESTETTTKKIRSLFRGLPIVLSIALPARVVYITSLEESRSLVSNLLTSSMNDSTKISTIASGIAGGVASLLTQILIVPMDVISQKQMVSSDKPLSVRQLLQDMNNNTTSTSSLRIFPSIYRGFAISLFTSLPSSVVWWGAYSGTQHKLYHILYKEENGENQTKHYESSSDKQFNNWKRPLLIQVISGTAAAFATALVSQPLDVVKTNYQLLDSNTPSSSSILSVVKKTHTHYGFKGFYRGTIPRMAHIAFFGTILSSAFEYLKYISQK